MKKKVNNIWLFIQFVLGVVIVIMMIASLFTNIFYDIIQILIVPELLVMALNTYSNLKGLEDKFKDKKYSNLSKQDIEEYKKSNINSCKLKIFLYLALAIFITISLIVGLF